MPITIEAQVLDYYDEKGIVEARGKVHLSYKEMELKAEHVWFDLNAEEIFAEIDVVYIEKASSIYANELRYNLRKETGEAKTVSTYEEPWYISGEKIRKVAPGEFSLEAGSFTSCDASPAHYRFTARTVKIYPKDRIIAKNVLFYIGKVPLLYLPVYRRSLKEVPSGFVVRPGYDSETGAFLLSHYNWYLSEKFKGRWYLDYMGKTGLGEGFDVRFDYGEKYPGWAYLYGYYIDESESPDEGEEPDERWKLHLRHQQEFKDTREIIKLDMTSDGDFSSDYLNEQVLHFLSRSELESHDPEAYLSVTMNKPRYSSYLYVKKRVNDFLEVTESMPELSFNLFQNSIPETSFYYSLNSGFSYLRDINFVEDSDNEVTETTDASQFELHPQFSHQTRIGWLSANPSFGLDGFLYSENQSGDENVFLGDYSASLPLTTANGIWRIFDTGGLGEIEKIKHSIFPKVSYSYRPDPPEGNEDVYDFMEGLSDEKNYLKLELSSELEGRKSSGEVFEMADFYAYTYFDLLDEDEPWSNIAAELEVSSLRNIFLEADASFDPSIGVLESFDTEFVVDRENWDFSTGVRYYEPDGEKDTFDVTGKLEVPLGKKWRVDLQTQYDLNEGEVKLGGISLYRELHCWEAQLFLQTERVDGDNEMTLFIAFKLKHLPGVGLKTSLADFFWQE